MTDSKQEPKIIDRFDRIKFLVDGEWKQIPSQQMLLALVHFPKPDEPDLYNLEDYRRRNDLRNRKYDSEENQLILRGWSNFLINGYADHLNMPFRLQYLQEYKPEIKHICHEFEVDANTVYFSVAGNEVASINGEPILPIETDPNLIEGTAKIVRWFLDNKLSYEKYVYADVMTKYCYAILPMTTSRYTAISGKLETATIEFQTIIKELEIAERDSPEDIRRLKILEREADAKHKSLCQKYPYYKKSSLFVESLKRRFPEFRDILPEYSSLHKQLIEDINIRNLFVIEAGETAKQIRKDKANKSGIEKELEIGIKIVSQCMFCYKFHKQTTNKEERGKTEPARYCPECEKYHQRWATNHKTPPRSNIPLNGW